MPARVDHLHRAFTVIKSSGNALRLIVDGSDAGHPNALNNRLPPPPPPPGMLRVATVIAIVTLSGDEAGVDDIETAFPTMEICRVMSRALGVAIAPSSHSPGMVLSAQRVPQGGTWSATVCQGHTLTAAIPPQEYPPVLPLPSVPVSPSDMAVLTPADWFPALARLGMVVHVDDVITSGATGSVDARRLRMRKSSAERFGVKWKPFSPAAPIVDALGIRFDVLQKHWSVKQAWADGFLQALRGWTQDSESDVQWARGCMAWIAQVLHIPLALVHLIDARWPRSAAVLSRVRVSYRHTMTLADRLSRWPRAPAAFYLQLSDACGYGWAGAALHGGAGIQGRWFRCTAGVLSTEPCCSDISIEIGSQEMVVGEAMASVATYVFAVGPRSAHREHLLLSDNDPWLSALAGAGSGSPPLAALIVFMWLLADGQLATAHVAGPDNTLDAASRFLASPLLSEVPPHSLPRWSTVGATQRCRHSASVLWDTVRALLPCTWQRRGDKIVETSRHGKSSCECPLP